MEHNHQTILAMPEVRNALRVYLALITQASHVGVFSNVNLDEAILGSMTKTHIQFVELSTKLNAALDQVADSVER